MNPQAKSRVLRHAHFAPAESMHRALGTSIAPSAPPADRRHSDRPARVLARASARLARSGMRRKKPASPVQRGRINPQQVVMRASAAMQGDRFLDYG